MMVRVHLRPCSHCQQAVQAVIMAVLIGTAFLHIGDGQSSVVRRQPVLFL